MVIPMFQRRFLSLLTIVSILLLLLLSHRIQAADYHKPLRLPTTQSVRLLAADGASGDHFGTDTAISADGNTAIVGAPGETHTTVVSNGAVYIFVRTMGQWVQQAKLLADPQQPNSAFGKAVAISADGNTVLIGAPFQSTRSAAYIFTRSGTTWVQQTILITPSIEGNDRFGWAVALSADGDTALIGAPYGKDRPDTAYVFSRAGTNWSQQAAFSSADDRFGWAVALSGDGDTALVGAIRDSSMVEDAGAAYIFVRRAGTWEQQARLVSTERASQDMFGLSVTLSDDGNMALIGSGDNTDPTWTKQGVAFVFTRNGTLWTEQSRLLAADGNRGNGFGTSIDLSANGNMALIGAYGQNNGGRENTGAAYLFTYNGVTWTQQNKLITVDHNEGKRFGESVSLSDSGDTALIGAPFDAVSGFTSNGAVYIFGEQITTPTPSATPAPSRPDTIGVYKEGMFYLRNSNITGFADLEIAFGGDQSDLPVVGDWDGDGRDTVGVYRGATGFFFLSNTNVAPSVAYTILLGNPGDMPFAGRWTTDMTGDGIGVHRPSTGILYQKRLLNTGTPDFVTALGRPGDTPFAGDWNGDGKDSIGTYNPSLFALNWCMTNDSQPGYFPVIDLCIRWRFAPQGEIIVGDWDGDGIHNIGGRVESGTFILHTTLTDTGSNLFPVFGPSGGKPIAGKWMLPSQPPIPGILNNSTTGSVINGENGDAD